MESSLTNITFCAGNKKVSMGKKSANLLGFIKNRLTSIKNSENKIVLLSEIYVSAILKVR